jgi:hypothetical protein
VTGTVETGDATLAGVVEATIPVCGSGWNGKKRVGARFETVVVNPAWVVCE